MSRVIDHFMVGAARLDVLQAQMQDLLAVALQPGGRHPDLGTHNALLGLGGSVYLEFIAPDPAAAPPSSPLAQTLAGMAGPSLCRFIVQGDSAEFERLADIYADEGWRAPVYDLGRITPEGDRLSWRLMIPEAGDAALFAPYVIDWQQTEHPSRRLHDSRCRWLAAEAGHPQADWLRRLWARLDVDIPVVRATRPYLQVRLATPEGEVVLVSGMAG